MINPFDRSRALAFSRGDVLFVGEGLEDCALLEHLTKKWPQKPVLLTQKEEPGIGLEQQFRDLVNIAFKEHVSGIGLLFDAEESRKKSISKLNKIFQKAELGFPSRANTIRKCDRHGVSVKIAYLINPAGKSSGALEALFARQVRDSEIGPCLESLLKCYHKISRMPIVKRDKVFVRSFLARQHPSNTGLRVALRQNSLNCDHKEFDAVRKFVDLFKPPPTE